MSTRTTPAAPAPAALLPARPEVAVRRAAWLTLAVACAAAYALALGNGFVWDDRMLILESPRIQSWRHIGDYFTLDFFQGTPRDELKYGYYRPLTSTSYLLDATLWRLRPLGFHVTNVVLHFVATLLAYALALRIVREAKAALLVALLFAVHPVHTETVTWIAGRTDLLSSIGILGALLFHARYRERGSRKDRAAGVACFALALLAKELAFVTPLLVLLYDAAMAPHLAWRRKLAALVPYAAVAAAYAMVRFGVLGIATGRRGSHLAAIPEIVRIAQFGQALFGYLAKTLVPASLSAYLRLPLQASLAAPAAFIGLLGGAALGVLAWWLLRRRPAAGFGLGLFIIGLLPVSNIVVPVTGPPDMGFVMAERFLYLPSLGVLLALAAFAVAPARSGWRLRGARLLVPAAAAVAVLFAVRAELRNLDWRDETTFFRMTVASAPDAPLLLNNLGIAEHRAGDLENAERHLRAAAAAPRASGAVMNNLAILLREKGDHGGAAQAFRAALRIDPDRADIHVNAGETMLKNGHPAEAAGAFRRAIALGAPGADVHLYLGTALGQTGDLAGALRAFEDADEEAPGRTETWENIGTTLRRMGRTEEAIAAFRKALEIDGKDATAWNGLGVALGEANRLREAEQALSQAALLDTRSGDALNNLGVLYHKGGRDVEAERVFRASLERQPDAPQTHGNLAAVLAALGRPAEALAHMRRAQALGAVFPAAVVADLEARAGAGAGGSASRSR